MADGYFLVKATHARVVSHSSLSTPPAPCGATLITNSSTGAGSFSTCMSTRTKSESALYSVPHRLRRWGLVQLAASLHGALICLLRISFQPAGEGSVHRV